MRQARLFEWRGKRLLRQSAGDDSAQEVADDEPAHTPRRLADCDEASYCDGPGNSSRDLGSGKQCSNRHRQKLLTQSRHRAFSEVRPDGPGAAPLRACRTPDELYRETHQAGER